MCYVEQIVKRPTELSPGEPAEMLVAQAKDGSRISDLVWIDEYWHGRLYPLAKSTWTEPGCRRRGIAQSLVKRLSDDYNLPVLVDEFSFLDDAARRFWEQMRAEGYAVIR